MARYAMILEPALNDAVSRALKERPENPLAAIGRWLIEAGVPPAASRAVADAEESSAELLARVESEDIAKRADWHELTALGRGCSITLVEERGINLKQLRAVAASVARRCPSENWEGSRPTGPTDADGKPAWQTVVLAPPAVSLYDVYKFVIMPATIERGCSFVELFAEAPQHPSWFVSHWWGEPIAEFIKCVATHARDHTEHGAEPDERTCYWVCAYANNQHDLDKDVTTNPADSSFVKAIVLAEGKVLSILDTGCVTYTRIWYVRRPLHT